MECCGYPALDSQTPWDFKGGILSANKVISTQATVVFP